MNLENRVKVVETKIHSKKKLEQPQFDLDGYFRRVGLDPDEVRATSLATNNSLMGTMCEMVGVDVREFKNELRKLRNQANPF